MHTNQPTAEEWNALEYAIIVLPVQSWLDVIHIYDSRQVRSLPSSEQAEPKRGSHNNMERYGAWALLAG
jgi:hypothetical protein